MHHLIKSFVVLTIVWKQQCSSWSPPRNLQLQQNQFWRPSGSITSRSRHFGPTNLFGAQVPSPDDLDSIKRQSEALFDQARRAKMEAERMESELTLAKIKKLEKTLHERAYDLSTSELKNIRNEILSLVKLVDPSIVVPDLLTSPNDKVISQDVNGSSRSTRQITTLPRPNDQYQERKQLKLSEQELEDAVTYFLSLPRSVRMVLAAVVQLDLEKTSPAVIIVSLYEFAEMIPPETFVSTYKTILATESKADNNTDRKVTERKGHEQLIRNARDLLGKSPEEYRADSIVESILPRVTRNRVKEPVAEDIDLFVKVACGKNTYMLSAAPEKIPGGFILRGNNKLKDGTELIQAIDSRLKDSVPEWSQNFQASFILDPTRTTVEESSNIDGDPVLLITSADFSPTTNRLLLTFISSISLFLSFIFCVATFGSNDVVMRRITEANNLGNYDTSWFNDLITPLAGAIAIIQLFHECGHSFFAWKDNFKMSSPTILPLITLPYLSFQRRLKTSPPDLMSLFNFAYAGPALGMLISSILLWVGLTLSVNMDSTALEYAPSLPVGLLRLSTLGGEVVDYFLGGNGLILLQDPSTPVPLHPFAIAGFAGLIINAIDCIPIGSTDGGRISQSLLGRTGHLVFSSIIFAGLFLYTLFSGHREIFITYLLLMSFAEKDVEVPCRNEIDRKADVPQVIASLILWIVASLILIPL